MRTLTPRQFADRHEVTVDTVYRWIREGRLRASRLGARLLRIPEDEAERFLRENLLEVTEGER